MGYLLLIFTTVIIFLVNIHLSRGTLRLVRWRRWWRALLHGGQLAWHAVRGRVMGRFRRMIFHSTRLFHAAMFRRFAAVRVTTRRCGWARLLNGGLILPLTKSLGANRWRSVVMFTAMQSSLSCRCRRLRRGRATRLNAARTRLLLLMRSIGRLVLRVSRLWRRHAVVVNWSHISPRAIWPVWHQWIGARTRWRSINSIRWWAGRPGSGRVGWGRTVVVGVRNARRRRSGW